MERWILYALLSMGFAGITAVIAKTGLSHITGELGLTVRTVFVSLFIFLFAAFMVPIDQFRTVRWHNIGWLAASGAATALSWIFYYKAIKIGDVSKVALIDKGSVVVAIILAVVFLGETLTWSMAIGSALIIAGVYVMAR
ncbi:MAG: EamA family transporter [Roseiflexaceae bacterium]